MNKDLAHLKKEEVEELIERYYSKTDKVKDLMKEYNIQTSKPLYTLFPPVITQEICPYCKDHLIRLYQARDYYSRFDENVICPLCKHYRSPFCDCSNCNKQRQKKKEIEKLERQDFIREFLGKRQPDPVDLNDLTFEEKIYLGAFLREGLSEDYNYISPTKDFINPLAPTAEYITDIITLLSNKKIITIHPDSSIDSFGKINPETKSLSYYKDKVKWRLNLYDSNKTKVPLIESIITPSYDNLDYEEAYHLWKKIALHEALEYLIYNIKNILGVDYNIGEKTFTVLNDLLNDYSVAQIYSFIYRSTNNALRFKKEQGISAKHAANAIIGNMQSYAERAKGNGWNVLNYHRDKRCPESALSKFFFERILAIGYAGFDEKPHIIQK